VQTFNSDLAWNPHVHALASRGGWDRDARSVPVAHVDSRTAEQPYRRLGRHLIRAPNYRLLRDPSRHGTK